MNAPIYFANPAGDGALKAMLNDQLGYIDTPEQGNARPYGVTWCADNGLYSPSRYLRGEAWDEDGWWAFLQKHAQDAHYAAFATAPDHLDWYLDDAGKPYCVGDAAKTLEKGKAWYPRIKALGFKVALVAQDGMAAEDIPWDDIDVLFIGGSDDFKVGTAPAGKVRPLKADGTPLGDPKCLPLIRAAKAHGKWVHLGRVNSMARFRFAHRVGADSADGTFLTFGPDKNLPKLLSWLEDAEAHPERAGNLL